MYQMSPHGYGHGLWQGDTITFAREALNHYLWTGTVTLKFDDGTNPEPDVIGWKDGQPIAVIEISDTTLKNDLGYKKQLYAANSIPYYLVIDLKKSEFYPFQLQDEDYHASNFFDPLIKSLKERNAFKE